MRSIRETATKRRFLVPAAIAFVIGGSGGFALAQHGESEPPSQAEEDAVIESFYENGGGPSAEDGVITPEEMERYLTPEEITVLRGTYRPGPDQEAERADLAEADEGSDDEAK